MARLLGEEWQGDVRVRWWDKGGEITVEYHQDAQNAVDLVAAVNAEGAPTIDGLGKPVIEVPVVAAQEWAARRGIPWEKLLYSNEYDDEFKRFAAEHSRLQYRSRKSVHAL
jgi:hypothetical protein